MLSIIVFDILLNTFFANLMFTNTSSALFDAFSNSISYGSELLSESHMLRLYRKMIGISIPIAISL